MKKDRKAVAVLIFRFSAFIISMMGIVMHILADGVVDAQFMVRHKAAYFTIQTNVMASVLFLHEIIQTLIILKRENKIKTVSVNPKAHLALASYITVTMLGFWLLLAPATGIPRNGFLFFNTMTLHTITPLLVLLDCFLFGEHGKVHKKAAFQWLLYPFVYLVFVMIFSSAVQEPYYSFKMNGKTVDLMVPYPFLDVQIMGIKGVVLAVLMLSVFFVLLGFLFIWIDHKIAEKANNKNASA